VDDHVLFAEAIRVSLGDLGIEVVEVVTTGEGALGAALASGPDVILMDLGLPDQSGLAAGKAILEAWPEARLLALTAISDRGMVDEALRIGFRGYLTKDTPVAQFAKAIRSVADGQLVLPRRLMSPAKPSAEVEHVAFLASQLTTREREVLELLVRGADGRMVARSLGISQNTVRTHVQSILTKLQVHSRLEAATFAVRHRLIPIPGNGGNESRASSSGSSAHRSRATPSGG
jgi:two-component system, NarL family, nitrate/nitrite response regulator NarL